MMNVVEFILYSGLKRQRSMIIGQHERIKDRQTYLSLLGKDDVLIVREIYLGMKRK